MNKLLLIVCILLIGCYAGQNQQQVQGSKYGPQYNDATEYLRSRFNLTDERLVRIEQKLDQLLEQKEKSVKP